MVRIHARQPSSTEADLRAIGDLQKLDTETAVIRFSGFTRLSDGECADNGAHLTWQIEVDGQSATKFFYFQ